MERPAPAHTPVHGVEQDLDHEQDHSWPHVPWLRLSRAMVESRELPAVPRHQGEVVAVPSSPTMPGWPEQGYDVVTAEGSSQRGRNVLLHEREEITAKECAVPQPGPGESERNQQAGKINSVSPRATGPWSFWLQFFFSFSLLNKT